jgi:serine/threonine-protein kinase RIO1
MALDFLRRDCSIMNDFFSKKKLRTLNMQDTYEFVTDFSIKDAEAHLAEKFEELGRRGDTLLNEEEQKDNIFREMYIPRSV